MIRSVESRATLLLLSLLGQSAAAATIAISIVSHADTIEIEGSALLNADAGVAWRVLTDYERYVDFIPGLRGSRVVARKGATVIVEESGDVMLWVLHRPMDVTFEILEYTGVLDSGLALVGPIERLAVKQNVALRFQALAEEIERRSAANRGRSVPM